MILELLAKCHCQLAPLLGQSAEPLSVTKHVERHRWFWRPETPRLILLAESHVHTTEAETNCMIRAHDLPANIPAEFVRLVYCLGYGESGLLDGTATGPNMEHLSFGRFSRVASVLCAQRAIFGTFRPVKAVPNSSF